MIQINPNANVSIRRMIGLFFTWGFFLFTGIFFSSILHETGHALACDLLEVEISNVLVTISGGSVEHFISGNPGKEMLFSFMGGFFAFLIFGFMFLIFYKIGDRVYLSVFLTYTINHLITAFIEGLVHNWYQHNANYVTVYGVLIGLFFSGSMFYLRDFTHFFTFSRARAQE